VPNLKNAIFFERILSEFDGLYRYQNYFFKLECRCILAGFAIEKVPGGAYLWNFAFPLFDPYDGVNFLYSQRVSGANGYVARSSLSDREFTTAVVECVRKEWVNFHHFASVKAFSEYVLSRPALTSHEHVQLVLGFAQLLACELDLASVSLDSAIPKIDPSFRKIAIKIREQISLDVSAAEQSIWAMVASKCLELGMKENKEDCSL
jgi:hypothetical protein